MPREEVLPILETIDTAEEIRQAIEKPEAFMQELATASTPVARKRALAKARPRIEPELKKRGLLGQVHLSHDAGWYRPSEEQRFRPYDFIFKTFLGKLKEAGLTDADIHQVTVENPAKALTVGVRRA